ncbi:hypothetical protein VTH82DRAFT_847 [Thermothelomyces myriococcoides]
MKRSKGYCGAYREMYSEKAAARE